jgi:hypothetical protein
MLPFAGGPATDLDHLYRTLRPEPLIEKEEFKSYYRPQVNEVRGEDAAAGLWLKLRQAYGTLPFRAFLMGHPGVGKSTETTRLLEHVEDQYVGVRLNVATELNPASFKVFDVLLLMLARLAERADEMRAIPLEGMLSAHLVSDIQQWFAPEQVKKTRTGTIGVEVEAGAGVKGGSPWAALLGFFASAKADAKYAAERKTETVEYHLQKLPDLVDYCNRLILVCDETLQAKTGKEWLLVVEDLDKTVISPPQLQELFLQYGNVFQDLRVNMIFTIPVWLAYSSEANRLPLKRYTIHDTPVYDQQHNPHESGRAAVQTVLEARVSPSLFAPGQMTRLIVASGGNLRDLFELVLDAGEGARLRNPLAMVIGPDDARAAIAKMRREYRMRLGQSPYDLHQIPYSEKLLRLIAVYNSASDNDVPDPVLYSLLRSRAVEEFNGEGWYGIHPLVVDILKDQQHLKPQDPGGTD